MNKRIRKKKEKSHFKPVVTVKNRSRNMDIHFIWDKRIHRNGVAGFILADGLPGMICVRVLKPHVLLEKISGSVFKIDDESGNYMITISRSTYEAIHSDSKERKRAAYFMILHEIGHVINGDNEDEEEIENANFDRGHLCLEGKVIVQEYRADAFAASVMGNDAVIRALQLVAQEEYNILKECGLEEDESLLRGYRELLARAELIRRLKKGEVISERETMWGTEAV